MNKKKASVTNPTKLKLNRETVINLTSGMLKNVVGGALPPTRQTQCGTECEFSNFCG
jgi:hypothetical protein